MSPSPLTALQGVVKKEPTYWKKIETFPQVTKQVCDFFNQVKDGTFGSPLGKHRSLRRSEDFEETVNIKPLIPLHTVIQSLEKTPYPMGQQELDEISFILLRDAALAFIVYGLFCSIFPLSPFVLSFVALVPGVPLYFRWVELREKEQCRALWITKALELDDQYREWEQFLINKEKIESAIKQAKTGVSPLFSTVNVRSVQDKLLAGNDKKHFAEETLAALLKYYQLDGPASVTGGMK